MELSLKQTDLDEELESFREISSSIAESPNMQELMSSWLNDRRSIAFMRSDEKPEHVIGISFEEDEQGIAVGMLPSTEAFKLCPALVVIPSTRDDAELDAFIENRNERLDIAFDEKLQVFFCPPNTLQELLFSYALAEKGFSKARLVQHENGQEFVELFLVILTSSGTPDWGETLHVSLEA